MSRPAAVPTVQVDNDRVRVTEWRFAPGAATGWHKHSHDYVVVPMTTGRLSLEQADGSVRHADLAAGASYANRAGVGRFQCPLMVQSGLSASRCNGRKSGPWCPSLLGRHQAVAAQQKAAVSRSHHEPVRQPFGYGQVA